MKKQILILLVIFITSLTAAFAQAPILTGSPTCPTPVGVTCLTAGALNPVPGTAYDYTVTVPTPLSGTKTFNWFVTQDQTFIQNSVLIATPEIGDGTGPHIQATGIGYNNPATGAATVNITWKYFTHNPALPVFLVIYVENSDCPTDNIEMFIIQPQHSFTLDIANIDIDGSAELADFETCVAPVAGAVYNAGTVQMDYGVNYIFFAVTAANFTDSWLPSFQLSGAGIADTRDITAVEWAYSADANQAAGVWHAMTESGADWTSATPVDAQGGTTVGVAGECIVVRITITNNQAETVAAAPIQLAVNGTMFDPVTSDYSNSALDDIDAITCALVDFDDNITQILAPRPDINEDTPTPFVPNNGVPAP